MIKKISVIVITYNHEKYIEQTIESILIQEGDFEIELLIGNDKSPDKTEEILKKYKNDSRIKIFNREMNIGPTKNLLDLLKRATGEYITILEGDDYWIDSKKLAKQLKILNENLDYSACITESIVIDEMGTTIGNKEIENSFIKNLDELFLVRGGIPTGTLFFRNYFFEISMELESLLTAGWIIGDLPLLAFLVNKGKIYNLKEKTGAYRYIEKSGTSYSAMENYKKNLELEKVIAAIIKFFPTVSLFIKVKLWKIRSELYKENKKFLEKLPTTEVYELKKFLRMKWIYNWFNSYQKRKLRKDLE